MKRFLGLMLFAVLSHGTFAKGLAAGFYRHPLSSCTNGKADSAQIQQAGIDTLTRRLVRALLERKTDEPLVKRSMQTMLENGSWSDVDYGDTSITNWKPLRHLERLTGMAAAYSLPGGTFYNNDKLKNKILLGLEYFSQRKPLSANWWYRDIGAPQHYMQPLLLLKGKIDNGRLLSLSRYLKDVTGNKSHQGKNRSWVSEITIYKGCIENDFALVNKGILSMASTLAVVHGLNDEGIKADFSFHQHHAQLYSGGYGLSLLDDYATYLLLVRQTAFEKAFSPEKRKLLAELMLKGHQLLGYRKVIDFGAVGRNISRAGGTSNIPVRVLDKMIVADPGHASAYARWKRHLNGEASAVTGNTFFPNSAIMTQHGANYYLSAKIITSRTYGTESLNGENIKGYNLPMGATNILTAGDEYFDVFPVWDWTRVPGTTAELNQEATALKGYQTGKNEFGGGVSNGACGAIAFEQDYHDVKARKAFFFIHGMLLCLGAGISAEKDNDVATSVNQAYSAGGVVMGFGSKTEPFTGQQESFQNLKWVYHNNVGYIFPGNDHVTVQNKNQSGSWHDLNLSEPDSMLTRKIFSLWVSHGREPSNSSYSYIVAPGLQLPQVRALAASNPFVIIKNDTLIQAVYNVHAQTHAIVFYQPSSVVLQGGLTVSSGQKALVLIQQKDKGYLISVADPAYSLSTIHISVSKALKGPHAVQQNGGTTITFDLPREDDAGSTVTGFYR